MQRRVRRLATAVASLTVAVTTAAPAFAAPDKLGAADRTRIAKAERAGDRTVTLLVAAKRGQVADAAADLRALGATVVERNARVDYLQVRVPTANALAAGKLESVAAVDVDAIVPLDDPQPEAAENPVPQTPPSASTPRANPYLPTTDTKTAEFVNANPTWDGRNTTVAIIDTGIDLDNPALQTTSTGEPKVVDWYDANATNSGDATWVAVSGSFFGTFTSNGQTWTAPATGGPYAFGLFDENAGELGQGELGGDVNRDGDRADRFGVLYDLAANEVRVDTGQDHDFTNDPRMTDYKVKFDLGHFGTDDPSTAVQERVPFVVDTHHANDTARFVGIGIAGAAHGSHVAGITAGNALFGGRMTGAAPGAKLIAIKACLTTSGCTGSGLLDGPLYAAEHGADVANISIGGLPALNYEGPGNARALMYDRIIREYGMQIFISAGNSGAGANSVGDPAIASDAVAVGASISKDTWRFNYGSIVDRAFSVMPFSSRGPAEDGAFKPQLSAPGSAISTIPLWQPGQPVAGVYTLPPGYAMFNGTSMAAPEATGTAAVLISAYKATFGGAQPADGPRPDPAALRSALIDSAVFQSGFGAYEQGAGLIQANNAWKKLSDKPAPRAISATVPVNTVLAGSLDPPGVGRGIHDREGVVAGGNYTRTYTLRRTSGPAGNETYSVAWTGDTSVFRSAKTVTLPLDQDVSFPVTVRPTTAGTFSAILRLDAKATPGIDLTTLNTVFVPAELTAANGYAATLSGTVARNGVQHLFVRVPLGASALRVDLTGGGAAAGAGQLRFLRFSPDGLPVDGNASTNCYDPDAGAGCSTGDPHSRTVVDPQAGVWEIVVEARRTSDVASAPFTVKAQALGTTVSPDPDTIASAALGTPVSRSWTVSNTLGPFTGRLAGGPLTSARTQRPTIAAGEQQQYPVTVPSGTTRLSGRIGNPSDARADLDLYLFNCTSGTCVQAAQSAGSTAQESVAVNNPAPGQWVVLVLGFAVPSGSTAFDYEDVLESPAYGSIAVADANADRPAGSQWTANGAVTANTAPGAGRILRGQVRVLTADGTQVGAGTVIVQSVT